MCDYNTQYPSKWKQHERTKKHQNNGKKIPRSDKTFVSICKICNHKTENKVSMETHILTKHSTREERKTNFKYYCKYCDFGTFNKELYNKHLTTLKHEKKELNIHFGYINKVKYNVHEIIDKNLICEKIYDINENELIVCNGPKISPYLRKYGIYDNDSKMSEWHKEWQSHFEDCIEKTYNKINDNQFKSRRSDVDLNDNEIIEFQNSKMTKKEVDDRLNDWELHRKKIIWVINGNDTIKTTIVNNEREFLEFENEPWKFESYINCDFIYLDINENIYKLNPKLVKSRMIEVQKPISKNNFINALKNSEKIFDNNDKIYQTNIFVRQQGAGNGKTYGIIQLLNSENFEHYDVFIFLTKQHSAKHIIKCEIDNQKQRGELPNIKIVNYEEKTKKHVFTIFNIKTKKKCKIIIGTFDSFIYSLANTKIEGVDKFVKMTKTIIDEELKCSDKGNVNYVDGIKLNKKLLLIGDEMQDLHENYVKAVIKITRERYVDFYAVGDKLQSISIEKNAFTFLENELPSDIININYIKPSNICRRFTNSELIDFINFIIPFDKYKFGDHKLKKITPYKNNDNNEKTLKFIEGKTIYSQDKDEDKINKEIDKIMKYYKKEVNDFDRKPNDFLIITPFVHTNPLVEYLHSAIREFWKDKYNTNNYNKYSIFHKSEYGTSIDLSESDDATRIVSIHSSKGDGRPVVFVIGLNEKGMNKYSKKTSNLIFDSLLHVALTRMKEKLYFRYEPNGDYIHKKICKYQCNNNSNDVVPYLKISNKIKLNKIINYNKETNFEKCNKNIIKLCELNKIKIAYENNKLIDMKHHCTRYASFITIMLLNIISYDNKVNNKTWRQPIYQKLKKINENDIRNHYDIRSYWQNLCCKDSQTIPILQYKQKSGDYKKYHMLLLDSVNKIKKKIKKYIDTENTIELSYFDIITLYHLIEITDNKQFTKMPISDMYDIVDMKYKKNKQEKELYQKSHYKKLEMINNMFVSFSRKYTNLKYLLNHAIYYGGNNKKYTLYKHFDLIAYNDKEVVICYIKPQFNDINYNEILLDSIFDTFLIRNLDEKKHKEPDKTSANFEEKKHKEHDKTSANFERFNNKDIITCIFTFDNNYEPYYIKWSNKDNDLIVKNELLIKNMIKNNFITKYKSYNEDIYYFFNYWFNKNKSKTSLDIIECIKDKYESKKKDHVNNVEFPHYIDKFFNSIISKIEELDRKKENTKKLLDKYLDKEYFLSELNYYLESSIHKYIGIPY